MKLNETLWNISIQHHSRASMTQSNLRGGLKSRILSRDGRVIVSDQSSAIWISSHGKRSVDMMSDRLVTNCGV